MSNKRKEENRLEDNFEFEVTDSPSPLLPEGIYEAVYIRHKTLTYFSRLKLFVWFKIVSLNEHNGVELFRAYNLYTPAKRNSDFVKECETVIGRRFRKKEKVSISLLKNKVVKIRVRNVKTNRKQDNVKGFMQYSVIDAILDTVVGKKEGSK